MAGKGKKKRNSKDSTGSNEKPKKGKGGAKKKSSGKAKSSKFQGDIFNEAAMENAYIVCHNVQVFYFNLFFIVKFTKIELKLIYIGCFEDKRICLARSSKKKEEGRKETIRI